MSPVLAAAISHPTRLSAFLILLERAATPKEIAAELGESDRTVGYHLKVLAELGCVKLTPVEPGASGRAGGRTYQVAERAYFDAEGWERLSGKVKLEVSITFMRVISSEINAAIAQGTFFDPDDNHISRSPMKMDPEGWKEVTALLDGIPDGLFEIQDRIDERCAADDESKTFPIKVEIIQFRSPDKSEREGRST